MKRVPLGPVLISGQLLSAVDVLSTLVKAPAPGQGFSFTEMRNRLKVLDKLEAAAKADYVDLEDAEHATLIGALNSSSFTLADKYLLQLLDGAFNAVAPPPVVNDP